MILIDLTGACKWICNVPAPSFAEDTRITSVRNYMKYDWHENVLFVI